MKYAEVASGVVVSARINFRGRSDSAEMASIQLDAGLGVAGDNHCGYTRLSDVREVQQGSSDGIRGVPVLNTRAVSIVSSEEIAEIEEAMGLPANTLPGLQGENLIVSGIPNLTQLPLGTILKFAPSTKGGGTISRAAVLVWGENFPCRGPGENIATHMKEVEPAWSSEEPYAKVANGRRGLVGMVYCSGVIKPGSVVTVCHPLAQD